MDIQNTRTNIKAGDPSEMKPDALHQFGFETYCFRINTPHVDGAQMAVCRYRPWWKTINSGWVPEIERLKDEFRAWTIKAKKKGDKDDDGRTITHTSFDDGKFSIPFGPEHDKFLEYYAKMILSGFRLFVTERTTPVFRLFMDLDFKQLRGITERGIEAASVVCAKTVSKFFPGLESHVIVCSTTYKEDHSEKDTDGNIIQRLKTGVHLYWPVYYVNGEQAMNIRESVIADLTETFGQRAPPNMNVWTDVVDEAVYPKANGRQGSGCRLIGSSKASKCGTCKGKKTDTVVCNTCFGDGRIIERDVNGCLGRPYMMLCVLKSPNEEGLIERDLVKERMYLDNMLKLIQDTFIRCEMSNERLLEITSFQLPQGAPLALENYTGGVKRKRDGTVVQQNPSKGEREVKDPTDPVYIELQKVIRSAFGQLYDQCVIRRVTKGTKQFTATVTGKNCRWCQNIRREHLSNNIYFVVSNEGIVQRCFDTGPLTQEMKNGPCKDYCSALQPLNDVSAKILWPEIKQQAKIMDPIKSKDSFILKCILNQGEMYSTKAFKISWTSTLGVQNLKDKHGLLTDFLPGPRDLGSRGVEAYKDLGLSWADALMDLIKGNTTSNDDNSITDNQLQEYSVSLNTLYKEIFEDLENIVQLAASARDPSIYQHCIDIDDFLAPLGNTMEKDDDDEVNDTTTMSPSSSKGPIITSNGLVIY